MNAILAAISLLHCCGAWGMGIAILRERVGPQKKGSPRRHRDREKKGKDEPQDTKDKGKD